MEGAKGTPIVGLGERIYETTKLAALFDMLSSQGHPASEILKNVNLPAKDVHSSTARISLKQLMTACSNAVRLSKDPHLAYRIGASIHVSTYRSLLDELRTQIALKYLRTTRFSNDDIASALGFSDAANFRRAFHRWTNKVPSDIRADVGSD